MTGVVTLLATNDLHGRLTPARAAWLAAEKVARAPGLLLDSGDAVACGNVGFRPRGEWMHDLMNVAGYDAGALGNREYHFRPWPQRCKLRRAGFPVLCANLRPVGYGGTAPAITCEPLPGVRLRIFGLLVPMVTDQMPARCLTPSRFDDPVAAARAQLAAESTAATICLSHLGLRRDRALAAAVPLTVILGGHSHTRIHPERVGDTLIVQGEPRGGSFSRVELAFEQGRLARVDAAAMTWPESL